MKQLHYINSKVAKVEHSTGTPGDGKRTTHLNLPVPGARSRETHAELSTAAQSRGLARDLPQH